MTRTTRDGFIGAAVLLAVLAAWAADARAQEPSLFGCRWYANDLYWGTRYRPPECWRYRRWSAHRHYVQPSATPGPRCKSLVRVVGWEANSKSGARIYGERAWFLAVRHDYGSRYANLDRARDPKVTCDPSTITQVAKRVLWICVVAAIPCQASEADAATAEKRFDRDNIEVD